MENEQQASHDDKDTTGNTIWAYVIIITFVMCIVVSWLAIVCNVVIVKLFEICFKSSDKAPIHRSQFLKIPRVERTLENQVWGSYQNIKPQYGETEWVICMSPFVDDDDVNVTNEWKHTFHSKWLREWYESISIIRLLTWPLCHSINREEMLNENENKENSDSSSVSQNGWEQGNRIPIWLQDIILSHQNSQNDEHAQSVVNNYVDELLWNERPSRFYSDRRPRINYLLLNSTVPNYLMVSRTESKIQPHLDPQNIIPAPRLSISKSQNVEDTNLNITEDHIGIPESRMLLSPQIIQPRSERLLMR